MPQYNTFKYGRIARYGRYKLTTTDKGALGPHTAYRIRTINSNRDKTDFVRMIRERIELPTQASRIRIRANNGEWVLIDNIEAPGDIYKVRIRALNKEGTSEWIYGERANLNLL